jgi:hypothetical protein
MELWLCDLRIGHFEAALQGGGYGWVVPTGYQGEVSQIAESLFCGFEQCVEVDVASQAE